MEINNSGGTVTGSGGGENSGRGSFTALTANITAFSTAAASATAAADALTVANKALAAANRECAETGEKAAGAMKDEGAACLSALESMEKFRTESGHMNEALGESGTAAARNAIAIDQMTSSIYDANPVMKDLLGHLDGIVKTAPTLAIYMNDLVNKFKDGQITGNQLNQAVQELKRGLDNLNSIGGGFMGDIDTKFSSIFTTVQNLIDAVGEGIKK